MLGLCYLLPLTFGHPALGALTLEINTALKTATLIGDDEGLTGLSLPVHVGMVTWQLLEDLPTPIESHVRANGPTNTIPPGTNDSTNSIELWGQNGKRSICVSVSVATTDGSVGATLPIWVSGAASFLDYSQEPPDQQEWLKGLIGRSLPVTAGINFEPINIVGVTLPPSTPLIHLPLNGDTCDISGNRNHGTASVSLTYGPDIDGNAGGAAIFTGNEKIDFEKFNIDTSAYTVTGSFKTSAPETMAILNLGGEDGGTYAALHIAGQLHFIDRPSGSNEGGSDLISDSELSYADETWHHFAIRKVGTTNTLFVDGAEINTGTVDAGTFDGMTRFIIGQSAVTSTEARFVGSLDEIRLYDSALTDDQILDLSMETTEPALLSITAFSLSSSLGTFDLAFNSYADVTYVIETSPDGQTWTPLPGDPIAGTTATTSVSDRALPTPVPNSLFLRVRCAPLE